MTLSTFNFTTGPATLPDVGVLSYNDCVFSPLFETSVSGVVVRDEAQRTTKFMEYNISADGYVTLGAGLTSISPTMDDLRRLLTAQAGTLVYQGRGCDIVVNATGGADKGRAGTRSQRDVAWGPAPELLEFQPLGGGLSAKVKWRCKVRISEQVANASKIPGLNSIIPLLQFNYETVVSYGEDGYSSISVRGTTEIPLTRSPSQRDRKVTVTVDDVRSIIDTRVMAGIDLSRFRVTKREFPVSRDKRTMNWSIVAEEKPYMDLPPDCTIARGTYSFRPARAGAGLVLWLCTLRATYTVRADQPRRTAWVTFLALLRLRMSMSLKANIPAPLRALTQNPPTPASTSSPQMPRTSTLVAALDPVSLLGGLTEHGIRQMFATNRAQNRNIENTRNVILIEFSGDEGLYLDSKTVTFSATWRLVTTFSHILLASGLWKKLPEKTSSGKNFWATSVKDIMGSSSWLPCKLDPNMDVIVDFGES